MEPPLHSVSHRIPKDQIPAKHGYKHRWNSILHFQLNDSRCLFSVPLSTKRSNRLYVCEVNVRAVWSGNSRNSPERRFLEIKYLATLISTSCPTVSWPSSKWSQHEWFYLGRRFDEHLNIELALDQSEGFSISHQQPFHIQSNMTIWPCRFVIGYIQLNVELRVILKFGRTGNFVHFSIQSKSLRPKALVEFWP